MKREFDFQGRDNYDRNATDLALELGYQNLIELLQRYGGYAQVLNIMKKKEAPRIKRFDHAIEAQDKENAGEDEKIVNFKTSIE